MPLLEAESEVGVANGSADDRAPGVLVDKPVREQLVQALHLLDGLERGQVVGAGHDVAALEVVETVQHAADGIREELAIVGLWIDVCRCAQICQVAVSAGQDVVDVLDQFGDLIELVSS